MLICVFRTWYRFSISQLTGVACVKRIVTDLAVLEVDPERGFVLIERAPGVTVEEIKKKTAGRLVVEGDVPEMKKINYISVNQ